jgi:hypothetical protein
MRSLSFSLSPSPYQSVNKGSIKAINPPATISGEFTLLALVHNASDHLWESSGPNSVHIVYKWLDQDWNMVPLDTEKTLLPEGGIAPGGTAEIKIHAQPPPDPGCYRLHLTLVPEGCEPSSLERFVPDVLAMEFKAIASPPHVPTPDSDYQAAKSRVAPDVVRADGKSPIFVHSLFRAGSTYFYSVFERSGAGYYCLQEPLHEWAFEALEDPAKLEKLGASSQVKARHPVLKYPYFHSLHGIWESVRPHLQAKAIYQDYFDPSHDQPALAYWKAVADYSAPKGRPVIQECRSSGRIRALRQLLGGKHIYLLRNPWDQWWSLQVNSYFEAAMQMIVAADNPPPSLLAIREYAAFSAPPFTDQHLSQRLVSLQKSPLSAESSYLLFYTLWCLALKEARQHADIIVDMDDLSHSPKSQQALAQRLADNGIAGLDFSDCRLPAGIYGQQDSAFFIPLELEVHSCLKADAWDASDFRAIEDFRAKHDARMRSAATSVDAILEQQERWRSIALRHQNRAAEARRQG